jgi:TPR repeat protein
MDPNACHRACVAFRVKLSRDTGVNLTTDDCLSLLGAVFEGRDEEQITLQYSTPGLFYSSLGAAIEGRWRGFDIPDHMQVAAFCYRESAVVHRDPEGMRRLAVYLSSGHQGGGGDPAQAAAWLHKAVDKGDAASKAILGGFLLDRGGGE